MRLKDTGLTAQELKDMVNKYMVETYERYDFIAERAEGMYLYDEEGNAYLISTVGLPLTAVVTEIQKSLQSNQGSVR